MKLLDEEERLEEQIGNPFAVIALAHLKAIKTRKNPADRLHWKLRLMKALYQHGYEREKIRRLFQFIDWLLALPEEQNQEFDRELARLEEENKMPFVTPRMKAIAKRHQDAILQVLEARFGLVSEPIKVALGAITNEKVLNRLTRKAATVASLDEFQVELPSAE